MWGIRMVVSQSLDWELKVCVSHSSVSPQRKVVNHSCLPGFCPKSVFTQPMTNLFISGTQEFLNLWTVVTRTHTTPLGGGRKVSPWFCLLLGPCWESGWWLRSGLQFMPTPSRKPLPGLTVCNWLPCSNAWELCHTQAPPFFLCPWDPETMLSHLGFHPALPPKHLSGKLLKVPILCSAAYKTFQSLAYGGSLPPWFILGYTTSDSCLHTSCLAKSGRLSICRIVAILFSDIWLILQVFGMIW